MMGINRVIVAGHLGQDPDCRATAEGKWVVNLSLATSRKWKNAEGQSQEDTEWHRVVAFGKTAELARLYLKKGRPVLIEGRLQTREWEDKEGRKRWTTEIVADAIHFLSSGQREGDVVTTEAQDLAAPSSTGRSAMKAPPSRANGTQRKSSAALADIPF